MAGKVAVLNDLAGFGRCSLTAAISVLSAMGVQPCPLPTAVLSAQTGFESYFFQDLTEQMGMITEEWKKSGAQFDGIVTGFMSDNRHIGEVNHFLDLFHKEGTFLLVDPVLGDNGKRFSVFDGLFQKEMKQLVKRADIVTPNYATVQKSACRFRHFRKKSFSVSRFRNILNLIIIIIRQKTKFRHIRRHDKWKKSGAQFDGIVTGFMSDHRQIGEVNHFLDLFHKDTSEKRASLSPVSEIF